MLDLLKTTFREFLDDDCPRLAAALSYYTIFSLPPLLLLILLIAGLVTDPSDIQGRLVEEVAGMLGPQGAEQIRQILTSVERPSGGGLLPTLLGIAALLFGATGAFAQLQAALNKAWEVEPQAKSGIRGFAMKRFLSFGMILIVAFLLLVSLALSAILGQAAGAVAGMLPAGETVLWAFDLVLSMAVITVLFAAMFKVLPDAEVAWRSVWLGAAVTAGLFVLGKFLIGFYIGRSDPGSAFGAAGSLAIVLIWIYYSGLVFFLGAEFTQVWARRHGMGIRPDEGAVRVGTSDSAG